MGSRLELHDLLKDILGSSNVYFQPPSSSELRYPCIKYEKNDELVWYGGNVSYIRRIQYTVTVIDKNPDSLIPGKVALLPTCRFERHYTADNLNHDVYSLYY